MNLKETEKVYKLVRLRYVDDQPNVLVTTYVPCRLFEHLSEVDFEKESLYQTFHKEGRDITSIQRKLDVILADETCADLLDVKMEILYFIFIPQDMMKVIQRLNIRLRNTGEIGIALFFNFQIMCIILNTFIYKYQFFCIIKHNKLKTANKTINSNAGGMTMSKIQMTTPLVEMDGDEMTRILWKMIKDELLLPFIDLKTEYYDLGLEHRNETNDQVTFDSAEATKKYGVAVKCATITPNAARMDEYDLKEMWKSPNGTIRAILDGTVFRAPITVKGIEPTVSKWKKPITIARHAYGDVYKGVEIKVPGAGKAELVFTGEDGTEIRETIHDFDGPGVIQECITLMHLLQVLQEAVLHMH